ncbi:thioredoxin-disulfide reductase [Hymenobacter sp. BT664]|uniref:Thioredoxin reductase n=1 Tax=Hymenobacter montanus TaxID=2771359 RepID=A0A927BAZ5_9BACT|nr:thioredoxin-disulfide reductase [Hymenobacter montanus]MBD2766844.1 thioredoxin-disulfide reductase [Hymenobacter montanus]
MSEHHKCLIIGSGPAGYTAAIYAARANLHPVMYVGLQPGGQLTTTTEVENFPGYPAGISGPNMMEELRQQAARFGTDIRSGLATQVDFSAQPHKITVDETVELTADAVIIATGATAKWLGLPSEARLNGAGVSACAVCDGFFYRGQEVAIVGAGDTAAEEALYLANLARKVTMIVRKGELKASKIMQQRVLDNPRIEVLFDTVTDEILGQHAVEGVRVKHVLTHETREIPLTGFFVAIGHEPNSRIFQAYLQHDERGYLQTLPGTSKTNIAGVFACGDVQDSTYRQAVTAAGTGCMAALDAERYLAGLGN